MRLWYPDFDTEKWMRENIKGMKRVRRWVELSLDKTLSDKMRRFAAGFLQNTASLIGLLGHRIEPNSSTPENLVEHHWKQSLIMIKMAAIELTVDNPHKLDFFVQLMWALTHDMGEQGPDGDVPYHEKRKDEATLRRIREREKVELQRIVSRFLPVEFSKYFVLPPNMEEQPSEAMSVFWDAAEHIGHCIFMLEEIELQNGDYSRRLRFYQDVRDKHVLWLEENAYQFVSVKEICEKEILVKYFKVARFL